jgi:hypothetical protein
MNVGHPSSAGDRWSNGRLPLLLMDLGLGKVVKEELGKQRHLGLEKA